MEFIMVQYLELPGIVMLLIMVQYIVIIRYNFAIYGQVEYFVVQFMAW